MVGDWFGKAGIADRFLPPLPVQENILLTIG